MTPTRNFVALDLGASGGRAMIGRFDGSRLHLEEAHRFPNGPIQVANAFGSSIHWDIMELFTQVKQGIAKAVSCCGGTLTSVGLDTWGVDYGLLDAQDNLLGYPYHYRDARSEGMMEEAFRRVPKSEIFAATGIQFMALNTLIQLVGAVHRRSPSLDIARTLLFVPDLLNFWLSGVKGNEYTIASTSQALDPFTRQWDTELLERLAIPTHIFQPIIPPGTVLGEMLPWVAEETGAKGVKLVAPGTHDTASAVAAVPAEGQDHAYLSSGTWSLIGVEAKQPVVNETALTLNFTNEGGICDTIRLLKNITGLWIIQECRRTWMLAGEKLSWDDIVKLAAAAPAFTAFIDVDAADFAAPGDMPARIRAYCQRTGQPVPRDKGTGARIVLESLALKYRRVAEMLEQLVERPISVMHIVGGGTQNRLLSQFAANALGRPVVSGPIEATAIGNILMQLLATGDIASLSEGRDLVRRSFPTETFVAQDAAAWQDAYARFATLLQVAG
jgi:rhamnulokinase